jgi:hypothetical protein
MTFASRWVAVFAVLVLPGLMAWTTPERVHAQSPAPSPAPGGRANMIVKIHWDDATDVDLWVYEPGRLPKIYYANPRGEGAFSGDEKRGGPNVWETYEVVNGLGGPYRAVVNMYNRNGVQGTTTVTYEIITNPGTSAQRTTGLRTVTLGAAGDTQSIGGADF